MLTRLYFLLSVVGGLSLAHPEIWPSLLLQLQFYLFSPTGEDTVLTMAVIPLTRFQRH